jgi:hypothetical protein
VDYAFYYILAAAIPLVLSTVQAVCNKPNRTLSQIFLLLKYGTAFFLNAALIGFTLLVLYGIYPLSPLAAPVTAAAAGLCVVTALVQIPACITEFKIFCRAKIDKTGESRQ